MAFIVLVLSIAFIVLSIVVLGLHRFGDALFTGLRTTVVICLHARYYPSRRGVLLGVMS